MRVDHKHDPIQVHGHSIAEDLTEILPLLAMQHNTSQLQALSPAPTVYVHLTHEDEDEADDHLEEDLCLSFGSPLDSAHIKSDLQVLARLLHLPLLLKALQLPVKVIPEPMMVRNMTSLFLSTQTMFKELDSPQYPDVVPVSPPSEHRRLWQISRCHFLGQPPSLLPPSLFIKGIGIWVRVAWRRGVLSVSVVSAMTMLAMDARRMGASSESGSSSAPSTTSLILVSPAVIRRWASAAKLSAPIHCISERCFMGINLHEPWLKHAVVVDETVELTCSVNVQGYFADSSHFPNGFVMITLHDPLEFLLDAFSMVLQSLLVFSDLNGEPLWDIAPNYSEHNYVWQDYEVLGHIRKVAYVTGLPSPQLSMGVSSHVSPLHLFLPTFPKLAQL
ncbi:hypothetical protein ARMGADRAFT_1037960 [Armillaria gallica]|uniref:Uncharacterized protein n=1 Tax=Armillaria gallica TaxID=47427 RepID=A0A2H3CJY9_ARMGA|nr:hypothetical protein ARMGADRAFT_1037960 [Armillaria gallica]